MEFDNLDKRMAEITREWVADKNPVLTRDQFDNIVAVCAAAVYPFDPGPKELNREYLRFSHFPFPAFMPLMRQVLDRFRPPFVTLDWDTIHGAVLTEHLRLKVQAK